MPSSTPEVTEWFANRHQSRLARAHTAAREDLDGVRACPLCHEELLDRGQDAAVLAHQRSAMAAV
ncbi:hypothetical protein [Streptomyces sp. NPDC002205]|uniref:hypothetical protein n=1 Tax=Streptomyces sp. NPDC002205 TaxID=3154411 RepID=UPI0033345044